MFRVRLRRLGGGVALRFAAATPRATRRTCSLCSHCCAQIDDGAAQAHRVLGYQPQEGGDALILDNRVDAVLPAARRSDLVPVFSFNSEGLRQGVGTGAAGGPAVRPARWREAPAKACAEGIVSEDRPR